jgi:hypothetical protein
MLPPVWQKITLFNPVVYLINGFRWSFYGKSDVNVVLSVSMTFAFMLICLSIIAWMFRTGTSSRTDGGFASTPFLAGAAKSGQVRATRRNWPRSTGRRLTKSCPAALTGTDQARRPPASSSPAPITMAPMPAHCGMFTVSLSLTENSTGPTFASCDSLVYENLPYASPSTRR